MGKATYKELVPPDDPMFTGGVELFRKTDISASESRVDENVPSHTPFKTHREFSVNWAGDRFTLEVCKDIWKRISSGKEVAIEVYEEKNNMYIHWHFNSDPEYSLILDYGDPTGDRWLGNLGLR
jgi:hypothetical protein